MKTKTINQLNATGFKFFQYTGSGILKGTKDEIIIGDILQTSILELSNNRKKSCLALAIIKGEAVLVNIEHSGNGMNVTPVENPGHKLNPNEAISLFEIKYISRKRN